MDNKKINPQDLMTVNDFARRHGVTRQTVFNWVKDGKVKKAAFLGKEFIDKSTLQVA